MGKKKLNRDLALKVLEVVGGVKDALDDLLDTMFIIYQPKDYYYENVGDNVSFTVVAMNVDSYLWQYSTDGETWYDNTSSTTGYNTDTISFTITTANKNRMRRCKLTDSDGNIIYSKAARAYQLT